MCCRLSAVLGTAALAACLSGNSCGAAPVRVEVKAGESLEEVRDRVRNMPESEKSGGVEIALAPGEYFLRKALLLRNRDGGVSRESSVVWRAAGPGKVLFSGGARIPPSSFAKVESPELLARLPEESRGRVYAADVSRVCRELAPGMKKDFTPSCAPDVFIDGRIATLAKWPNGDGWMTFKKRVDTGTLVKGEMYKGGAFICSDPRLARWDFGKGVWLNGYFTHDWHNCSAKAVSWGEENGKKDVVRIDPEMQVHYGIMRGTWGPHERRFCALNLFEELDEPGEWWLDREALVLYVVAPEGGMKDSTDVRMAFSRLPLVDGGCVGNVRFEGIDFSFSCGPLVNFANCTNVVFSECRFGCTIHSAAVVLNGMENAVRGCEVSQCGAAGICVSGGDRKSLVPSGSVVENCRIHDYGIRQRTYAAAVKIDGCGIVMRGCGIWNAPHVAVFYHGNDLLMESNEVHHVLLETGDAGAFYTGRDWTTQGNVLRYNFVHDIGEGTSKDASAHDSNSVYGTNAMGFYFDDCGCGVEAYGNVFLNCPRGILLGGGRDHPIRNNVFMNCRLGLSIDCRGWRWKKRGKWNVPGTSCDLLGKALKMDYTNDVWTAKYPRLARIMDEHPCEPLYNPVEDNLFVDCDKVISIEEVIKYNDDGTAPGILSRMAPIRRNTVVYTQGTNIVRRQVFDPRIASGFTVFNGR